MHDAISPTERKLYDLFSSDLGRECFKEMQNELFWEEPEECEFSGVKFAFYDGRRSVLRNIKCTVEKVEHILRKQNEGVASNG